MTCVYGNKLFKHHVLHNSFAGSNTTGGIVNGGVGLCCLFGMNGPNSLSLPCAVLMQNKVSSA